MGKSSQKTKIIREFSAGGVVFKKEKGEIYWLVAKATPGPDFPDNVWRLCKGWLDDDAGGKDPGPLGSGERKAKEEDIRKAAIKEVKEEGGIIAEIVQKIGTTRWFIGNRGLKFVTFYLMEYKKNARGGFGWETEKILWLPFKEAREKLSHEREKEILDKANGLLGSGIQENLI